MPRGAPAHAAGPTDVPNMDESSRPPAVLFPPMFMALSSVQYGYNMIQLHRKRDVGRVIEALQFCF